MCKLAYLHATPEVTQEKRHAAVGTILRNSWELGNRDGVGILYPEGRIDGPIHDFSEVP